MIEIRELRTTDSAKIELFIKELSEDTKKMWTHYKSAYDVYIEESYKIIALDENIIVGLAYLIPNKEHPYTPALGVVVAEKYQERGIGTDLILSLEGWAKEQWFRGIFLTTFVNNIKAQHLYINNGYYIIGKVLRDGKESFAMKKDIGKIVITGGSGFIGTQLALSLPKDNLVILDVKPPIDKLKEYWTYTDILDSYSVHEGCKDAQYIYHLAANPIPRIANKNPTYDLKLNTFGTLNVINAALKNNSRLLFASTGLIERDGNYAVSKRASELYIKSYVKRCNLDAVIIRLENVYGPTQKLGFVIPDFIYKLKNNSTELKIGGTGNDVREFVFIDDVVNALKTVMRLGKNGEIYPIGSGKVVTIKELGIIIRDVMGLNSIISTEKHEMIDIDRTPVDCTKTKALRWYPKYRLDEGIKECVKRG